MSLRVYVKKGVELLNNKGMDKLLKYTIQLWAGFEING